MQKYLLEMKGISKIFDGQEILKNVDISLEHGEIHAIIGENGAGKSTLMKILAGVEQKSSGEIFIEGERADIQNPLDAQRLGISTIFQEFQLISSLNVIENIFLGRWITKGFGGLSVINWNRTLREAEKILRYINLDVDPYLKVSCLGAGQKKMVEIARALCWKSKILVIDEATAALSDQDSERLFDIIKKSKDKGISIFFISHKINEVMKIADTISIMRDGVLVETKRKHEIDIKSIINKMAGDDFVNRYPKIKQEIGREVLRVEHLKDNNVLQDISFSLYKREILGLTGLVGSGRTAVANAIFGINASKQGKIFINNREVQILCPEDAIKHRIGLIPENRGEGLIQSMGIHENISLSDIESITINYIIDHGLEKRLISQYVKQLGIKSENITQKVRHLSGGNQQKVMIARCMLTHSNIFIFDEPSKGLDIPSKVQIYNLMNEFIVNDGAILLISSDINELLGMCDRILVMHKGRIVKELAGQQMNEANIVYYASTGLCE